MKKLLSLLLALVLVLSLVACSENTQTETTGETTEETVAETTAEETTEETTAEAPAESTSEIAKIGLGTSVSLKPTAITEEGGQTQSNVTIAALAFDAEGKIVKANIDVAQSTVKLNADGTLETPAEELTFKTKKELGPEYDMVKASEIGKEWFEQAEGFENFIIGKTAEEVLGIATEKADEEHQAKPTDPDLISSTTIDIGAFQKAVADAWENSKDAQGATQLGLGVTTGLGHSTKEADGENGTTVQYETKMAATALDAEGKVVTTIIDNAQNSVAFAVDGTVAPEQATEGTTKKHLGTEYGMAKASAIGKEWFEQVEGFENWAVGKTNDEISGLAVEEGKTTDADLLATTTITITGLQEALVKSIESAK